MNDDDDVLPLDSISDDDMRALYDKAKREFTEARLQEYLIEEEVFPLEDLIAEMEELSRQEQLKSVAR